MREEAIEKKGIKDKTEELVGKEKEGVIEAGKEDYSMKQKKLINLVQEIQTGNEGLRRKL